MIKIHADDYGISKSINKNILKTIDEGYVNSVSIITNNLSIEYAKKIARRNIDLHLHLCLTENISVSQKKDTDITKKGILNRDILFFLIKYNFLSKNKKDRINKLIKLEVQEQIKTYQELFNLRKIKIDGHQHVHLNKYIFQFLIDHPDIEEIRVPIDRYKINFKTNIFKISILINILKRKLINICLKDKMIFINKSNKFRCKYFYGILFSGIMNKEILHNNIEEINLNKNNAMILFHPGYSEDGEIIENLTKKQSYYYKSSKRIDENNACKDPILKKLF